MILALLLLAQLSGNVREAPPPPPPQAAPQLTRAPAIVSQVPAVYPPERLARGETADVALLVDIAADGSVAAAQVAQGAGPDFDAAALAAVKQFRFSPAEVDGKPAAVRIRYVYHFVIQQQRKVAPAVTGTVKGEVSEAGTRRPVRGAEISDDTGATAATDAQGRFSLTTAAGARKLRAVSPGYEARDLLVTVPANETVELKRIWLHREEVGDLQATVKGEKARDAPTRRTLTHDELVNVPGTLNDPIRAIQNLPGIDRAPFLGGQLLVRGTPPGDTGTYLDGHRIPLLYHFLGGPSVINEQLLDHIDFYPGGYGAYYGRNLTGAIDVGTRKPDQTGLHGSASLDLLEAVASVEGPLGENTSGAIAARRSHIDLFLPLFLPNNPDRGSISIVPVYWDYQARLDHRLGPAEELSLLFFGSDDRLSVVQKGGRRALPVTADTHLAFHRGVITWQRAFSDALTVRVSPAVGWTKQSFDSLGAGAGSYAAGQSADLTVLTGELRAEAALELLPELTLRTGLDGEGDRASYAVDLQTARDLQSLGVPVTQQITFQRVQPALLIGEYAEAILRLGNLEVTPGLRFDEFHWRGHTRASVDPRLWSRYALSKQTALKAYVGLYHQPPTGQQIDPDLGNADLGLEWAAQFGGGVEHHFSDLWSVSAEVFYNRRGSIVSPVSATRNADGSIHNPRFLNVGIGRTYGLELLIRREFTERLYGFLAYTLSRSQLIANPGDPWRAFTYDQPHIFTLVMGYRPNTRWELSTRFRYVSGNPYAPVDYSTFDADAGGFVAQRATFGEGRLPSFLQLDARAQYTWAYTLWSLSLYLDVENLTNHRNEELHVYDYRYRDQGSIPGLPILPTFGLKARF